MNTKRWTLTLLLESGEVIDEKIIFALNRADALNQVKLLMMHQGLSCKFKLKMAKPKRKWARKDTATGKGMNEGYCVNDGEAYFADRQDLIKYLREEMNVDENNELSDDFILEEAYAEDEYYYTEWDIEDSDYYYEEQPDGTLIEIQL